jgi:hypothetical protein
LKRASPETNLHGKGRQYIFLEKERKRERERGVRVKVYNATFNNISAISRSNPKSAFYYYFLNGQCFLLAVIYFNTFLWFPPPIKLIAAI